MIDIEKLKQAALNATQGEWMRLFGERTVYDRLEDGCRGNAIVRADTCFTEQDTKNLTHIATSNPSAVLELITRLEDLEVVNLSILTDLGNLEEKLVAQELVIQQLRDALIFWDDCDKALAIPASTKHLEAWHKGQVGDAVAYQEYTEDGKSYYLVYSKQATKKQTPLHAIKPFPFKGE